MSTFIKKNDDETWTEWSKRVPDNDEDKLDYIKDTIYEYCQWGGECTREMTDMMLQMGVEDLIPLLDNEKLLLDAIEFAYLDIRAAKKMNPTCMKKYKEEEDITYKKNDDETWTEWSKRVPDNDDEKMYYIEDVIYEYCEYGGPTMARLVTNRLLGYAHSCGDASLELSGVADLIPLLESEELLDAKIKEAYEAIRLKWESEKVPSCDEKEEDEEVYKKEVKPVTTLTVAEMIEALSKLPPDAKLVMTESGFYSVEEFAKVMLPEPYIVGTRNTDYKPDLPDGTQVYRIGHSTQLP